MKSFIKSLMLLVLFAQVSLAQAAAGAPAQNPLMSMFPLIVIFVIFYFLLIRPQQKKAKEHQKMLNEIKKDDKIITNGGLYAVVTNVKGEIIEAKIAEGVKVQLAKGAISTIVKDENQVVTPEIVK